MPYSKRQIGWKIVIIVFVWRNYSLAPNTSMCHWICYAHHYWDVTVTRPMNRNVFYPTLMCLRIMPLTSRGTRMGVILHRLLAHLRKPPLLIHHPAPLPAHPQRARLARVPRPQRPPHPPNPPNPPRRAQRVPHGSPPAGRTRCVLLAHAPRIPARTDNAANGSRRASSSFIRRAAGPRSQCHA